MSEQSCRRIGSVRECGREPRDGETRWDEWRCYSDGLGELLTFCPECAGRGVLGARKRSRGGAGRRHAPARLGCLADDRDVER